VLEGAALEGDWVALEELLVCGLLLEVESGVAVLELDDDVCELLDWSCAIMLL